jgi:hypothetical protein
LGENAIGSQDREPRLFAMPGRGGLDVFHQARDALAALFLGANEVPPFSSERGRL